MSEDAFICIFSTVALTVSIVAFAAYYSYKRHCEHLEIMAGRRDVPEVKPYEEPDPE